LAKRMTVRETDAFALLKEHLFALASGKIAETGRVPALLAGCWHESWAPNRNECVRESSDAWRMYGGSRRC
jgi:hypothetical protein